MDRRGMADIYTIEVTVRLDAMPAEDLIMPTSGDGHALFFEPAGQWLEQLLEHDQLLVRYRPFNSSPGIATFDLTGLDQALVQLRESCRL